MGSSVQIRNRRASKMSAKLLRAFSNQVFGARAYSAAAHGPSATAGGHGGGARLWKILSFTVAVPGVALCWINSDLKEKEHHEHFQRPEFVAYDHLRLRSKGFPWGDGNHSLFHNKEVNALPEGYEEEE